MADAAPNSSPNVNGTQSRFRQFCSTNPVHSLHSTISASGLPRVDHPPRDNQTSAASTANENAKSRMGSMKCCCGKSDCAYLEHNNAALGGLEKDLETAARLGQALLDRHEAYVKESQAEQARVASYITELEDEKTQLQDANHKMIVENRELLQKLEQLNMVFGESGKRVHELEDLLQDCEQEIKRLNGLTRKTQDLELKVLDMETECAKLTKNFEDGKTETRSTLVRWRESERKVRELEQEVRRIEWSANADREKHEEIVARMERDRALERELGLSEGRLKATAAVQNLQHAGPQRQVVSNFVRDILQDNANLQAGIAELRDLLQSSNDEVQNLREQVMLHQPVLDEEDSTPQRQPSLGEELGLGQALPKQVQRDVHVHHHYHTNLGAKKEKTPGRRTPRRKALMPSALSSSPSSSDVSTPLVKPQRYGSASSLPGSVRQHPAKSNRWSMQSTATTSTYLSSMASSPRSYFERNSSIFDRIERGEESSRPTSPESFTISSPVPFKQRAQSNDDALSVFEEENLHGGDQIDPLDMASEHDIPSHDAMDKELSRNDEDQDPFFDAHLTPKPSMTLQPLSQDDATTPKPQAVNRQPPVHVTNCAQQEVEWVPPLDEFLAPGQPAKDRSTQKDEYPAEIGNTPISPREAQLPQIRASIRRSNSHDSLLSISGMDIHLAQNPRSASSALHLLGSSTSGANRHHFAATPVALRQPLISAALPLAEVTELTATSRHNLDSASPSIMALSDMRANAFRDAPPTLQSKGLIGSVGGWVSSKWGRAPTPRKSTADLRSAASCSGRPPVTGAHFTRSEFVISRDTSILSASSSSTTTSSKRSISSNAREIPARDGPSAISPIEGSMLGSSFMGRPPGINQLGPIPGFAAAIAAKKAPTTVAPQVNVEVLKESLME